MTVSNYIHIIKRRLECDNIILLSAKGINNTLKIKGVKNGNENVEFTIPLPAKGTFCY